MSDTSESSGREDSQLNSATIKYSAAVSGTFERRTPRRKERLITVKHISSSPLSPVAFLAYILTHPERKGNFEKRRK